jgi:hypothetical protein
MQRHYLQPCQLLSRRCFGLLLAAIGPERVGFDDFRSNVQLLPASGESAFRLRLPLHRGPHGSYNARVAERVGQIEGDWSRVRARAPEVVLDQAVMRLDLLKRALRRRLLSPSGARVRLNRADPPRHRARLCRAGRHGRRTVGRHGRDLAAAGTDRAIAH